ncbi:MAG: hypothetical protein C0614_12660 [Desulfuromonas sp.]|nr:MAG: hypothetical protein C0614_12660 [Desulfuromonas sp.]
MKATVLLTLIIVGAAFCLVADVQAQLTRESGASSIAGTLQKTVDDADDYLLHSDGQQILFIDLDAAVYINRETHTGHDTAPETVATDSTGETTHEEGGCGGGPAEFALELFDLGEELICQAGKPKAPGWDTDPRMACVIENPGDYILRVRFASSEGHADTQTGIPKVHPYLLNLSLRKLGGNEQQIEVDRAIKQSRNDLAYKE